MLINKPLESILENDLRSLEENQIPEGKFLEYKAVLENSEKVKRKLLISVSAFANTMGGDLIFGMSQIDGEYKLTGIEGIDFDNEKQRIQNLIRDCIEPSIIPSLTIHQIILKDLKTAIIVRVKKSWNSPHVVKFSKDLWRFYIRSEAGNIPLDVQELRSAFFLSETTADKIKKYRSERITSIMTKDTPVPLDDNPKIVLHIIPINAFRQNDKFDISLLYQNRHDLMKVWTENVAFRYNFDGILTYPPFSSDKKSTYAYSQFYRNGIIELVDVETIRTWSNDKIIPYYFEEKIIQSLNNFLKYLKILEIDPPFVIMLSFIGVHGHVVAISGKTDLRNHKIDRNILLLPDVMMESYDVNLVELMKETFDIVWNASGLPSSMNYDAKGNWQLNPAY